eukprot:362860-Chlamydomonas_euryale.AAC.3
MRLFAAAAASCECKVPASDVRRAHLQVVGFLTQSAGGVGSEFGVAGVTALARLLPSNACACTRPKMSRWAAAAATAAPKKGRSSLEPPLLNSQRCQIAWVAKIQRTNAAVGWRRCRRCRCRRRPRRGC